MPGFLLPSEIRSRIPQFWLPGILLPGENLAGIPTGVKMFWERWWQRRVGNRKWKHYYCVTKTFKHILSVMIVLMWLRDVHWERNPEVKHIQSRNILFKWPGACFLKAPGTLWARKAIAKSWTLRLQSCFIHIQWYSKDGLRFPSHTKFQA